MLPGFEAARFQKVYGSWMGDVTDHIAVTPVDRAVERLRSIYRNWTRDTSVEQMRRDWDAAFAGSMPVECRPVALDRSCCDGREL